MSKINIGFEKIEPTPHYPDGYDCASYKGLKWESKATGVVAFKVEIKKLLRATQVGRCCYCRRRMGDIQDVHIEHFIEKSAFPDFSFDPHNLSLSCSTCNTQKNAIYRRISARFSRTASRVAQRDVVVKRCPSLAGLYCKNILDESEYRWFHPHLDNFSDHVAIRKNWIFVPKSIKGRRCIRSLNLNKLYSLEERAAAERLAGKRGSLAFATCALSELSELTAPTMYTIVVNEIRRRRKLPPI